MIDLSDPFVSGTIKSEIKSRKRKLQHRHSCNSWKALPVGASENLRQITMFHAKRLFTYATILGTLASVADAGPPSVTAPMPSFDWFDFSQLGPLPGLALPESGCVVVAYVAGHDLKEPWLQRIAPLCKDGAAPPGPVHVLAQMVGIPEPDPKTAPGLGKVVVYRSV
jgi:hypothetical protein